MSTNEIADILLKYFASHNWPIFLTTFAGHGIHEADVFAVSMNGITNEFEIKRSRADFQNDFKSKTYKHRNLQNRNALYVYDEWKKGKRTGETVTRIIIPNRFFFVCETGLIKPEEVPEYAGLIYVDERNRKDITYVKDAPLLHRIKANEGLYKRVAHVLSQRIVFGCSYYTYRFRDKNGKH